MSTFALKFWVGMITLWAVLALFIMARHEGLRVDPKGRVLPTPDPAYPKYRPSDIITVYPTVEIPTAKAKEIQTLEKWLIVRRKHGITTIESSYCPLVKVNPSYTSWEISFAPAATPETKQHEN